MIRSNAIGEKVSPKQRAAEIINKVLNTEFDYLVQERVYRDESMTDREWKMVQTQLGNFLDRISKIYRGYVY